MSTEQTSPRLTYGPLYFLAALGAGGLTVTFFLYLMFWVPHAGRSVPVFEDIMAAFVAGTILTKIMISIAWAGIAIFSALLVQMLVWNLREMARFRKTEGFTALHAGNAESQMMAIPLTLAMGVNGGFILGLVFVPGLWSIVEYLFPLAMVTFVAIGVYG
ncbi:TsoY family (seleno)protein, partial [Litoreibacter halocynthiae]|uniref:TsoY family (seleno)protein n=1 Tax=Litoreibacter halocynthiae TaxID=1242689 RepID=UPI003D7D54AF